MLDDNVLQENTRTKTRGEMKIRDPLFIVTFFSKWLSKRLSFSAIIVKITIKALKHQNIVYKICLCENEDISDK